MTRIAAQEATQKQPRLVDHKYRRSFKGQACEACGRDDDTIVGAHIRAGHEAGTGIKPDDALIVALCFSCHADQESSPGADWWLLVFKNLLRQRYREWERG